MDKFGDEWEGVFVGDHPFIQLAIVLYWSHFPVFLFDEKESAGIWGFRASDPLKTQVGL
jgi:hypothetical protein